MTKLNKTNTAIMVSLLIFGGSAYAESPNCGDPVDDSWISPDVMQKQVESLGYTIDSMGTSEGNCYEVKGLNATGNAMTAFFDPRTGSVIQEDVIE